MNPLATSLTVMAALFLALLFEYVPGFTNLYQPLSPQYKKLIMLGLLVLVAAVSMALSCYSPYAMGIACNQESAWELGFAVIIAAAAGIGTNQGLHSLTKRDGKT